MTEGAKWGGRLSRYLVLTALAACCLAVAGCTNDPYPDADRDEKVLYSAFVEAPKTLDPAVSYSAEEHVITGNVYDTLLEYHYLERPYRLIPGLAEAVPESQTLPEGRQAYRFKIRPDVLFHTDPCFTLSQSGRQTREVIAADFAFALARVADPAVNSPAISSFAQIVGLCRLRQAPRRAAPRATPSSPRCRPGSSTPAPAASPASSRTATTSSKSSWPSPTRRSSTGSPCPSPTPVAWEAVAYYNGREGRPHFADHAVGTGPYRLALYEKQHRFTLERNRGVVRQPAGQPRSARRRLSRRRSTPEDIAEGRIDASYAGRQMPFLERIKFYREREDIPLFNKFLQGYYDNGGIIKESFDAVVQSGRLSPEMQARGMRLDKEVEPTIFYVGFNMGDPVRRGTRPASAAASCARP